MTTLAESHGDREQLVTMLRELQANRIVLDRLATGYGVFRFTGGIVPREAWNLGAVTTYLQHPFAAGRIPTAGAQRYRHLAETIVELGQEAITRTAPRTLRCRVDIADRFDRDSSEIRTLGSRLQSSMARLIEESK